MLLFEIWYIFKWQNTFSFWLTHCGYHIVAGVLLLFLFLFWAEWILAFLSLILRYWSKSSEVFWLKPNLNLKRNLLFRGPYSWCCIWWSAHLNWLQPFWLSPVHTFPVWTIWWTEKLLTLAPSSFFFTDPTFVHAHLIPDSAEKNDDKLYFFFREKASEMGQSPMTQSRIGRICLVSFHINQQTSWWSSKLKGIYVS